MTGKTHIVGGVASGMALASVTPLDPTTLVFAGAVGGLLPDICHGGSKIGRKFPILSKIINTIFGHRTFTHSLLFLLLVWIVLEMLIPIDAIKVGVLVGMISHLILDAATKNGIKLLYPLQVTVRFPVTTRTGGAVEYIVLFALTLITVYCAKDIYL